MEVFDRIVGNSSGPAADLANSTVETTLYDKIVPDNTIHPDGALVIDWIADYLNNTAGVSALDVNFYFGGIQIANYHDAGDPVGALRYVMSGKVVISAAGFKTVVGLLTNYGFNSSTRTVKGAQIDNAGAGAANVLRTQESNYAGITQALLAGNLHLKMTAKHGTANANIDFALRSLQITYLPP